MKAKTIPILIVTTILALIWCSAAWADRSNMRDHRQTRRIRQGIRGNEITRPEVLRLKKEQRRIDRTYHRGTADGYLNWRERQRLNKMQNRASRHMYRKKYNHVRRHLNRKYHNGAHRAFRRRHVVVHNHNINCYHPAIVTGYADGYGFTVGVSDIGWQFAFSGFNSR